MQNHCLMESVLLTTASLRTYLAKTPDPQSKEPKRINQHHADRLLRKTVKTHSLNG